MSYHVVLNLCKLITKSATKSTDYRKRFRESRECNDYLYARMEQAYCAGLMKSLSIIAVDVAQDLTEIDGHDLRIIAKCDMTKYL